MSRIILVVSLAVLPGFGASSFAQTQRFSLVGVWKIAELQAATGAATTNPQAGLFIFTTKHYSMIFVEGTEPRPEFELPQATASELLAMLGPFAAQAGTYEFEGNELTVHPIVAKSPRAMRGNSTIYEVMKDGEAIWLRPKPETGGSSPYWRKWPRMKLARIE